MKKTTIAICYDFDKTLTLGNMQEYSFIPNLGLTPDEFWTITNRFAKKNQADITLCFLLSMLTEASKRGIEVTRDYLKALGTDINFADGVKTWFKRLNNYADKLGARLEHYIISTGNKEMIEGTPIFKEFKNVFACEFLYDKNGKAYWPKSVVNYTAKTQYLFRICKGTQDITDEHTVNKRIPNKHVEFRNMIYIGDGMTDVPCMTLVKERGGTAIAVYAGDKTAGINELLCDNRVNYVCRNNYKAGSSLEKILKMIIESNVLKEQLLHKETVHKKKANNKK